LCAVSVDFRYLYVKCFVMLYLSEYFGYVHNDVTSLNPNWSLLSEAVP
jgi:hypothetical protein